MNQNLCKVFVYKNLQFVNNLLHCGYPSLVKTPMKNFLGLFPVPPVLQDQSHVSDLKARLDWGEPALTIVDVRNWIVFNQGRIQGAVSIPEPGLVAYALANLEPIRDLYVYGETDEETNAAAAKLRAAGFQYVSVLQGGFEAWKAAQYPVEAVAA
jgi:rhodanese-related sulfurtransferase